MGLSRLDNFLKSTRGTILYVDPGSLDSTDSIENQGNSLTRPFKTLQRALIEATRFSYQRGLDNDRFNKTTILLYPGDHIVDNRPGYIPDGSNSFKRRSGETVSDLVPFELDTNFDLTTADNALYKLNSVHGGVIVPRGVSIVGLDLRKTKIRPKYVPNPENEQIERSAVFRVTGGCYFWQFTVLDADPNSVCYKDYTTNIFVPNFSHHKLTAFEYADGTNNVSIKDDFYPSGLSYDRTDLDMYYEKVGIAYGQSSGRSIEPDYPSSSIDIQTVVDEYRIVGSRGAEVGISSIKSGNGTVSTTEITVTLSSPLAGLSVDTPIRINGVNATGYDGQHVVYAVNSPTQIVYKVQNAPENPLPSPIGSTLNISVDTVTSASPYIFNISLRSVYGMCGLLADGDKSDGFKSMIVAQFTGIGLQKDDNAFVKYDSVSGTYKDSSSYVNLHSDSLARFKPDYENFHIKATNNAFIQLVSIFAIGYAQHFVSESGGDLSITNSNSNFGAKSLVASGFRRESFPRDDIGYITHILPPREIESLEKSVEFISIDVNKTIGIANTNRLYLYNETNVDLPPITVIDGYRLGAKENDRLNVQISQSGVTTQYSARIIMPNTQFTSSESSSQKVFNVGRSVSGINSIASDIFTLTSNHSFILGESVRVISENGHLPDGLNATQVYYAITKSIDNTLLDNQIKVAQSQNDAIRNTPISINNKGGILSIVSRVSDKNSGEIGHPVQWDGSQWYVNVATAATDNNIYSTILSLGTSGLGAATPRTYITRKSDTRSLIDTIYQFRYVIPKDSPLTARPPLDGYVLEESTNVLGVGTTEIQKYLDPTNSSTLSNSTELRNPRFIANASWSSNTANIITELPHDLVVGSQVEIINVKSTNNPIGIANSSFNGTFTITGISSSKHFSYALVDSPGSFANDTSVRDSNLPTFRKKKYVGTYQIYRSQEFQKYIPGKQDGVYHLIVTNSSNAPTVTPYSDIKFSQPIQNLYPQTNRDNPTSDPKEAASFAIPNPIGQVVINDAQRSITKETLNKSLIDFNVGVALTDIKSNLSGTIHTLYSKIDHGLAGITSVSIVSGGSGYGSISGTAGNAYNARLVGFAGSTTGENATAVITFNTSGTITNVKIIDGGSAYGIGNTLRVVGVATTTGYAEAVVQVTNLVNNINDTIQLDGISPSSNDPYNTLYKIVGIETGKPKEIIVESSTTVGNASTTGIGITATLNSYAKIVGKSLGITSFAYAPSVGLATVTFASSHGFKVGNKIRISGSNSPFFNGDFLVKKVGTTTSFVLNVGLGTNTVSTSGTITAHRYGFGSYGGDTTESNENLGGRFIFEYGGITTILRDNILANAPDNTQLLIDNADVIGLRIGDYIQIDDEIMRVKSDVVGSNVSVFRGLFGTKRETHTIDAVVRKINVRPIEFRRNSIIRASGHTFEYVGFGPGNYSTALPERQDRIISPQEELIAQNTKIDGGISIFTAMNSNGDFYTGNKKVNSATGQEEVFNAPVPSITGEEIDPGNISIGFDILTPLEASITRSIRVEGGTDGNLISEFDGPVIFNNKITSTSDKGIEANSIYIQGDEIVSRKVSLSKDEPTFAGNYGDIYFNSEPGKYDFIGWTYVTENNWEPFGFIGGQGIGIASAGNYVGFSTLVDFTVSGINLTSEYDIQSGITTLNFDANPKIGISSGVFNNFIGLATQINFVGYGATVRTDFNPLTGIATVTIVATDTDRVGTPGLPSKSLQYNNSGDFGGIPISQFDDVNDLIVLGGIGNPLNSIYINNSGYVGFSSNRPTSKIEIVADNETSLYIKSTSGSNIVRVDNTSNDTTPFIIDQNGNVGINTVNTIASLDVLGNAAITGEVRIYESDRSNYIGLGVTSLSSNLNFKLPTSYGINGQSLITNGSGTLSWKQVSNQEVRSGSGITISYATVGSGITVATIANAGITSLIPGNNVQISVIGGTATISAVPRDPQNIYPFTTRGFSMPI